MFDVLKLAQDALCNMVNRFIVLQNVLLAIHILNDKWTGGLSIIQQRQ